MPVEEIAETRFLSPATILAHLIQNYEQGADIDIYQFVTTEQMMTISEALDVLPQPYKLRDIYEYFSENFSYDAIRWTLAFHNKAKQTVAE